MTQHRRCLLHAARLAPSTISTHPLPTHTAPSAATSCRTLHTSCTAALPIQAISNRVQQSMTDAVKHVVKSAAKSAVGRLKNGMLEDDDYYRNGLPEPHFTLDKLKATLDEQQNTRHTTASQSPSANTPTSSPAAAKTSSHTVPQHTIPSSASSTSSIDHVTLQTVFDQHRHIDPYRVAATDISQVTDSITGELIGTDHPVLRKVASYFFNVTGKRIRPAIVFLISRAVNAGLDTPDGMRQNLLHGPQYDETDVIELLPTQRRISEIAEMIHTASLLHDDVIDGSSTRRGVPTVNSVFGNKLAILGGDFLLARSSLAMGRLRNDAVTESVSTVIEHLVKGEIMQLKPDYRLGSGNAESDAVDFHKNRQTYLTKSFYKTASLLAYSSKAVATLGGQSIQVQDIAFEYGKQVGLAFQIVDDILDVTGTSSTMGKAVGGADLKAGVLTLPLLFAAEECPNLRPILNGKARMTDQNEIRTALHTTIYESNAIERSKRAAEECIESAVAAILHLKPSIYQSALISLAQSVLSRQK